MKRACAIAISAGILWCGTVLAADTAKVESSVLPVNTTIGTPVIYRLSVTAPAGSEIELPDVRGAFKECEIVTVSRTRRAVWWSVREAVAYTVRSFVPGNYTISGREVRVRKGKDASWQSISVPQRSFEVKSMLAVSPEPPFKDIKGMVSRVPWFWVWCVAGAALFFACLVWFRRKKSRLRGGVFVSARPAHEIALEQLEMLAHKDLPAQGKWKEYVSAVSDIVRRYLEQRFFVKAPEMTTEEFFMYARDAGKLASSHKDLLKSFLTVCDLVKFAAYVPAHEEGTQLFTTAQRFIIQTKEEQPSAKEAK